MKTTPLPEILKQITPLPYSVTRIHPSVDVGNGDGPQPMPEISKEIPGIGWEDVGYFHSRTDRDYLTHAANVLPGLVEALRELLESASKTAAAVNEAQHQARHALSLATNVPTP